MALGAFGRVAGHLLDQFKALGSANPSRRALWRESARAADLEGIEEGRRDLVGRAGSLRVRLSTLPVDSAWGTSIAISGRSIPAGLSVRLESLGTGLRGLRGVREIETGDEPFDRVAWVEGSPAVVRALLDAETRGVLRSLLKGRFQPGGQGPIWASGWIERGVLRIHVPEVPPPAPGLGEAADDGSPLAGEVYLEGERKLPLVLRAALALAQRLSAPGDVAGRLVENLPAEPVAGVRLRLLTTLVREFPGHPAIREALLRARDDPDAEVRVRAAIALGEEGRDVLLAAAHGEGAEDAVTARAVTALGSHLDRGQAEDILRDALRTRRPATVKACLGALARMGGEEAASTLARVLAIEKGELGIAAAEALGETGDAAAEGPLLEALSHAPDGVRGAAARALGSVGTSAAVPPLKAAERQGGELGRAAREAVARIQLRLAGSTGAAPGQVSLASDAPGQVSLAEPDESGRLTLAEGASPPQSPRDPTDERPTPPPRSGRPSPPRRSGAPRSPPRNPRPRDGG